LPPGATSGKPLKELDVPRVCLACRPESVNIHLNWGFI
jgi:hypothetical protein